ncbi:MULTISPECIES: hypothetical protein [Cyanophyceae]|jgi:uncharacterized protein YceH (UPF0502 family)|uniref:Uncharacterized protein n=1 Tax=Aphanothece cf. minutissima CCALA 015 TaxID=2107695 RepID=A0ABX5FBL9_9CHRO|nr:MULTISPECIES: hypothetical protein [Cyanophyceae]MCP9799149.1 hypothetical protein [Cyanobium sp. Lug-B]MCP9933704.1 hypothetical protein [Cyanobium sp. Candia 9D4]PSB39245.1 hypothetical protein C7B81_00910 [Aphanothece cf. minutissima CCALA 015]
MSAPQSLAKAAMNRLAARLGSGLADVAATLAALAQEAPARVQQELSLFWEEVAMEAERIENDRGAGAAGRGGAAEDPQERIDALRAKVAELSRRLDRMPATPDGPPRSPGQP